MGNSVLTDLDGESIVLNDTDLPISEVADALQLSNPLIASMVRWSSNTQPVHADYMYSGEGGGGDGVGGSNTRAGGLFDRDRYVTPRKIYDQMRLAQSAICDDVVDGFLETTESLAFGGISMWSEDEDEQDVWNQIAADLDLDGRLREIWRELATCSQVYIATWWGQKSFKVRGQTDAGNARRRRFDNLQVPMAMTILDPLKVAPVGQFVFGQERLAYVASRDEADAFDQVLLGGAAAAADPIVSRIIMGRYNPPKAEQRELAEAGLTDTKNLFLMNPAFVFRHTATRPGYKRFADVRMKSVFELLDLKNALRQMERSHLLGASSFIILIKKGTDQLPAKPAEIENLQANVRTIARVPVIVGDHRLTIEIITPKVDNTLKPERHNTIDGRITARLFGMFVLGNYHAGGGSDDSVKLTRVVASGMESRRHMIMRTLESKLWQRVVDRNEQLKEQPKLRFHPKRIALNFDNAWASFLLDIRATGDLSRDTLLNEFDFNQEDEAVRREREAERYDDIFQTQIPGAPASITAPGTEGEKVAPAGKGTVTPPGGRATTDPKSPAQKRAGRQGGGNRSGGGAAPGSGQGQPARNPRKKSD